MTEFLKLRTANCKNCYKCIRHCPVKSIRFSGNQAHIVHEECILCGQCFVVCPQDAKQIVDQTETARVLIQSGAPVYMSIAPSFIANYDGVGIEGVRRAVQALGFADVEETAVGATIVKREYERMLREEQRNVLISSCCPTVNLLIQKYFPSLLPDLAEILSPMLAHGADLKRRHPGAKVVFVGPCLSKMDEAASYPGMIDAVLTFADLTRWLASAGVPLEKGLDATQKSRARSFPTTGGILKSMDLDAPGYAYMAIDGAENCIAALRDIEKGSIDHCFVEMSACVGSCISGPVMEKYHRSPIRDTAAVIRYTGSEDFNVAQPAPAELSKPMMPILNFARTPSESEITDALRQMGKTRPEDELNCGSCGYNTCREKAIAIVQGKAEISMCLPYLKEKAENFSDNILNNSPNGIVVLSESLEVQQINRTALRLMNIPRAGDVLGEPVVRILDPKPFLDVQESGSSVRNQRVYLAEYDRYVEQTIVPDREFRALLCILRDVTDEEKARAKREKITNETVAIADKVVDKQMCIVQEIASLLGETAAETKIALTKLKETMTHE